VIMTHTLPAFAGRPLTLGDTIDLITSTSNSNKSVTGSTEEVDGTSIDFQYKVVESTSTLLENMSVAGQVSVGCSLISASARVEFAQSNQRKKNSCFVMISVSCVGPKESIRYPSLTPAASTYLKKNGVASFQQLYGNYFLKDILYGGDFYCVLEIFTEDEKKQEEITLTIKVTLLFWSFEQSFKTIHEQLSHKAKMRLYYYNSCEGRSQTYEGSVIKPELIEELTAKGRNFPKQYEETRKSNPAQVVKSYVFQDLNTLSNFSSSCVKTITWGTTTYLQQLNRLLQSYELTIINAKNYLENPNKYESNSKIGEVTEVINTVQGLINKLHQIVSSGDFDQPQEFPLSSIYAVNIPRKRTT